MEERWLEIKFCFFVKSLFRKFKGNIATIDLLDIICGLGNCDETIIKSLVRQVRTGSGIINTTRLESVYFAEKFGMSYRDLYKYARIGQHTRQKYSAMLKERDWGFDRSTAHTTRMEYENLVKFMDTLNEIGDILCKK